MKLDVSAWKALPTKGFGQKAQQFKGGKQSKLRVTIDFIVNATGEKESPSLYGNRKILALSSTSRKTSYRWNTSLRVKLG